MTTTVPQWVETQHAAFIRWCNMHLESKNCEPIHDLTRDLKSGVKLIELLEIVCKDTLGKYHTNPKAIQAYENIDIALDYIKHQKIQLVGIGAQDVVDGNLKLILGLIWILILKYTISDISEQGMTAKEGLLLWCQRKTSGYDHVNVKDFGPSWTSGLALCAILDHYRPDLIDYKELDYSKPEQNITLALELAEKVGIPRLVEVDDVLHARDDKSLVTYLAYWFHAFNSLDDIESAGRRVEKFHDVFSTAFRLRTEYEKLATKLLDGMQATMERWEETDFSSQIIVTSEHATFLHYKEHTKRNWIATRTQLVELLGNIRIKLSTYGFKEYIPRDGLKISDIANAWTALIDAEAKHSRVLGEKFRLVKQTARLEFAEIANELATTLGGLSLNLSNLEGELEDQLIDITKTSEKLIALTSSLSELETSNERCKQLGIGENDHTVYTFDELEYELSMARQSVANKLAFVENQIVARSLTSVTPALLDDFETVFRHFDKTQRNSLQQTEFSSAVKSLGLDFTEDEIAQRFEQISGKDGQVTFRQFIEFMVSESEEEQSVEQTRKSFREISAGKNYLTREDLENALLDDEIIDSLLELMPKTEHGYDFEKYIETITPKID